MASFTLTQYNTLCTAIAQGVLEVDYGDKRVIYRSLAEMLKLKNIMAIELGLVKKDGGRKYAEHNKGLE